MSDEDIDYPISLESGIKYTPAEHLWYVHMRGCGCAKGDEMAIEAWKVFVAIACMHDDRRQLIYKDDYHELLTHMIDGAGLIDHGGTIGGSWLSDKGKKFVESIKIALEEQMGIDWEISV